MATLAGSVGYQQANAKYSKQYLDYKADCLSLNTANEKKGLPVDSVKEYKEWLKDQPLTINDIKVFHIFGVFSDQETRELKSRVRSLRNVQKN